MQSAKLIECPRDAWQGLADFIPTEIKAEYLTELVRAGFKHIDAVSFVSPKHVRQMADSEEVMKALEEERSSKRIGKSLEAQLIRKPRRQFAAASR